jgi:hypothetical protein
MLFTISSADAAAAGNNPNGGYQADTRITKSVRVVTTAQFYLQQ